MRVLTAVGKNFSSYRELSLDLVNKGLTLVSGPTGSGKSTLCDLVPWILFGKTTKNGSVDDVRSWFSSEATIGKATLELPSNDTVTITRSRKPNDLYYSVNHGAEKRGKDLPDTQKQLDDLLGVTYESYLSGSYFHEFSTVVSFFTANAKIRKSIIEQLVDTSFIDSLIAKISLSKKESTAALQHDEQRIETAKAHLAYLEKQIQEEKRRAKSWSENNKNKILSLQHKARNFETSKREAIATIASDYRYAKLEIINDINNLETSIKPNEDFAEKLKNVEMSLTELGDGKCESCGAKTNNSDRMVLIKKQYEISNAQQASNQSKIQIKILQDRLKVKEKAEAKAISEAEARQNIYLEQLEAVKIEINEADEWVKKTENNYIEAKEEVLILEQYLLDLKLKLSDVELLKDVIDLYKIEIVRSTIAEIERMTNESLSEYFDAEIRVVFSADVSDKIDISVYKDGNSTSYHQLSKGQRQLLKLSFCVAIMKAVQTRNRVTFDNLFFDEALDGLDDNFKIKAYNLLQKLSAEYESVFVVEHNEGLKSMFPRKIHVTSENGESYIAEA